MNSEVQKIEDGLSNLKLDRLAEFTRRLEDISGGFNTMLAPVYIRDFIMAYDLTSTLLATSMRLLGAAESALDTAESIAYMDNAPEYLESKQVKDTDAARKRYVPLDKGVQDAQRAKQKAEAMVAFLRGKSYTFRAAYEAVKKIAYSGEYSNSPNEGME